MHYLRQSNGNPRDVTLKSSRGQKYVGLIILVSQNKFTKLLMGPRMISTMYHYPRQGAQWLSGRVLGLRPRGRRFEPHRHHCVVVLEQDTFILA